MEWTNTNTSRPSAEIGEAGQPPIISNNVLCFWSPEQAMDVGYYDHEADAWFSANTFEEWDAPPAMWSTVEAPHC